MAMDSTTAQRHPAQYLALAIGVVYTLVGLAGFLVTGFDDFTSPDGELLLGLFEVNPLHNVVHLVIGLAGLALWSRLNTARDYGWMLAIGYGAVFVFGLFVAGDESSSNFLALNAADNWLHIASAIAGLAIALWPASDRRADADRAHGSMTETHRTDSNRGMPDDLRVEHDDRSRIDRR
jgi:uncharacterized membrane protein YuzA (DUF378 family)